MTKLLNMLAEASNAISLFPADSESHQSMKSDADQLAEDWNSVGDDLRHAMSQEASENGEKTEEK